MLELMSLLITLTSYIYSFVFGNDFKSAVGNCYWDQFPGCKGICISPPLFLDVPLFGIRLTLWRLHLHSYIVFELISKTYTYTFNRFELRM